MKLLITGNTSMLAKCLCIRLAQNHTVLTAGRDRTATVFLDLMPPYQSLPTIEAVDAIIHCAASFAGDTPEEMLTNELVNSAGCLRVGQLAVAAQCRHLIYTSSISVFDHPENQYFGSYGLSKRHGEENLTLLCHKNDIRFTALQLAQLYDAAGEARRHQGLFYHIVDAARAGQDVIFQGTLDPYRNYLFVDDVVATVERVLQTETVGIYPCVHPHSLPLSEIAQTAFAVFGRGGTVRFDATRPNLRTTYIPTDLRLYKAIDYSPATDLRTGLQHLRAALRE